MLAQIINQIQSESRKKFNALSEKPLDRYGPSDHPPVGARKIKNHSPLKMMAVDTPITPKKGPQTGLSSVSALDILGDLGVFAGPE